MRRCCCSDNCYPCHTCCYSAGCVVNGTWEVLDDPPAGWPDEVKAIWNAHKTGSFGSLAFEVDNSGNPNFRYWFGDNELHYARKWCEGGVWLLNVHVIGANYTFDIGSGFETVEDSCCGGSETQNAFASVTIVYNGTHYGILLTNGVTWTWAVSGNLCCGRGDVPEWEAGVEYAAGAVVTVDGSYYRALVTSTGLNPPDHLEAWDVIPQCEHRDTDQCASNDAICQEEA